MQKSTMKEPRTCFKLLRKLSWFPSKKWHVLKFANGQWLWNDNISCDLETTRGHFIITLGVEMCKAVYTLSSSKVTGFSEVVCNYPANQRVIDQSFRLDAVRKKNIRQAQVVKTSQSFLISFFFSKESVFVTPTGNFLWFQMLLQDGCNIFLILILST